MCEAQLMVVAITRGAARAGCPFCVFDSATSGHSDRTLTVSLPLLTNPDLDLVTRHTEEPSGRCETPNNVPNLCFSAFGFQLSLIFSRGRRAILPIFVVAICSDMYGTSHFPVLCSSGPWCSACSSSSTGQTVPFGTPGIFLFSCK